MFFLIKNVFFLIRKQLNNAGTDGLFSAGCPNRRVTRTVPGCWWIRMQHFHPANDMFGTPGVSSKGRIRCDPSIGFWPLFASGCRKQTDIRKTDSIPSGFPPGWKDHWWIFSDRLVPEPGRHSGYAGTLSCLQYVNQPGQGITIEADFQVYIKVVVKRQWNTARKWCVNWSFIWSYRNRKQGAEGRCFVQLRFPVSKSMPIQIVLSAVLDLCEICVALVFDVLAPEFRSGLPGIATVWLLCSVHKHAPVSILLQNGLRCIACYDRFSVKKEDVVP